MSVSQWKPIIKKEEAPSSTKKQTERGFGYYSNTKQVKVGSGTSVYRVNVEDGLFLGSEQFDNAPFRVNMAGQLWATSVNTLQQEITVETTGNIQTAINTLASTGGMVKLKSGTYVLTDDITIPSNVKLIGNGQTVTLLYFSLQDKGVRASGGSAYSVGTVTISNGTNIVSGGSNWTTNLTSSHRIRLDNFWYEIYAVSSATTLVLTTNYTGMDLSGVTYDSAVMTQNFAVEDLSVIYSAGTGIYFNYVYYWFMNRVTVAYCGGAGVDINNSTSSHMAWVNTFDNTGNGDDFNQVDHLETQTLWSLRNGGIGVYGVNVSDTNFTSILGRNNDDGAYFDGLTDSVIYASDCSNNTSEGLELVNSSDCFIVSSEFQNNGTDGVKLVSDCDRITISGLSVKNNTNWGINIASSTDDNNILAGIAFLDNGSGDVNDQGTNTRNDTQISTPWLPGTLTVAYSGNHNTTGTAYVKLGEIQTYRTGTITTYFGLSNLNNSRDAYGRVYKNGVAAGTERSHGDNTAEYYAENLGVTSGDLIQLYGYIVDGGGDTCKTYDFSIRVNSIIDNKINS